MKHLLRILLGTLVVAIALIWALPQWAPAQAVHWVAPNNPGLTGAFTPNQSLSALSLIPVGAAPEHVACDSSQTLFTSIDGGQVLFRRAADGNWSTLGNTGGRPLGLRSDGSGGLIIADAIKGLLHMDATGLVTTIADSVDGQALKFVDDLDIDDRGRIYFSDASQRFDYSQVALDFFEGSQTGRLLRFDPATQDIQIMISDLFFANGVTLGPNDDYVLVNETGLGRVHRLWLRGERAGQQELFIDELPGTPDNIRFDGVDTFWIAMPSLRASLDDIAPWPRLRALLSFLPIHLLEAAADPASFIIGVNLQGEVTHNLQNQGSAFHYITGVTPCGDTLYLGSLRTDAIGVLPIP